MDETVLCYIRRNNQLLMLYRNKEKDDINKGKWVGVGGHIEKGESQEDALKREVLEETGLIVGDFVYRGELTFVNDDYQEIMYLYLVTGFSGNMIDCDEGELHWVDISKVMDLNLWEGDRVFLPLLLETNEFIKMTLIYKNDKLMKVVRE